MQDEGYSVGEVAGLIRRRRRIISRTFVILILLSVVIAYSFETLYRSSGSIVIEQPEVAGQFIPGTYQTPNREQRIARINDEVMTTDNLAKVVEKHNLYADLRQGRPARSMVSKLRENFELDLILAADDPRKRFSGEATGFALSYYHPEPETARDVARTIVDLFLERNLQRRQDAYVNTEAALTRESVGLRDRVANLEEQLANFKTENPGALPEDRNYNRQIIERKSRDMTQLDREIRSLQERKTLLQSQLAQTDPWISTIGPDGNPLSGSNDRSQQLQSEYLRLLGIYSPNYPDVVRIRREIDSLTGGAANPAFRQALEAELTAKQMALYEAKNQYGANYPDVLNLERAIVALEEQIAQLPKASNDLPEPNNPTYVNLELQLGGVDIELSALQQDRRELQTETSELDEMVQIAPEVEKRYLALTRDLTIARDQYEDTMTRQLAVERAGALEEEELAERYVVKRMPSTSYAPAFPNRPLIIIIGIFMGATLGIGLGILAEVLDESIRNTRDIKSIIGAPPIAAIPIIQTESEVRTVHRSRWLSLVVLSAAVIMVTVYVQLQRTGTI